MFFTDKNALLYECDNSYIRIEPYGENVLRVRARRDNNFGVRDYALLPVNEVEAYINIGEKSAEIINGKARATIEESGERRRTIRVHFRYLGKALLSIGN